MSPNKLMLIPGDVMWSSSGTHVCDDSGFATTITKNTVVEFTDTEKYCHVYEYVANERIRRNASLGYSNVDLWVVPNPEFTLPAIRMNTMLVPHPTLTGVYMPKASQCGCSSVYAVTAVDPVSFDTPWAPKKREKTTTREEIRTNKVFATSNVQDVVYDEASDKYIMKNIEIKYPVMETMNIYDEAGNVITQKEMQKIERIVETIIDPVLDDKNKPIMEYVMNELNEIVMEPAVPERYFEGDNEITYEQYKSSSTAVKAVQVACSLVSGF